MYCPYCPWSTSNLSSMRSHVMSMHTDMIIKTKDDMEQFRAMFGRKRKAVVTTPPENKTISNKEKFMQEFKVEKNVPLPEPRSRYPFAEMEVGDSFTVPQGEESVRAVAAASSHGRTYDKKFSSRAQGDVVRIWRVQ